MSTVRINKFFTEQGFCSRRAADRMVGESRVRINGRVAVLGDQLTNADVVTVDGRVVSHRPQPVYLAYHKPVGVTCTTEPHVAGNIVHAVGYPERGVRTRAGIRGHRGSPVPAVLSETTGEGRPGAERNHQAVPDEKGGCD